MWKPVLTLMLLACAAQAEVRTLTLREAVALAMKQNPDVLLARLDERKAEQAVRLARDPFVPKIVVGSGLAYSSGFPMSIEGATPSIIQARGISDVFNRPQSYRIASAKESRRGAAIDAAAKQQDAAYRTAELYYSVEKSERLVSLGKQQVEAFQGIADAVEARIAVGRELPIEGRRAAANLARARYNAQVLETESAYAERSLAEVLGMNPNDRVQAAQEERKPPVLPDSEDAAVASALSNSRELRSMESKLLAKGYDIRAERAERWPKLDLVAQYALLGRFNNYEQFFKAFQRNNGQLGVSVQVPLWSGPGIDAATQQAEGEAAQIRVQIHSARSRISADTRRYFQQVKQAEMGREVARMDLEVARDQVSILLAQMQEGRAGMRQVEEARSGEAEKWIAFYNALEDLEKARLNLLKETGTLLAELQ